MQYTLSMKAPWENMNTLTPRFDFGRFFSAMSSGGIEPGAYLWKNTREREKDYFYRMLDAFVYEVQSKPTSTSTP